MNISNPKQIGNPGKSPGEHQMVMIIYYYNTAALHYELMLKEENAKHSSSSKATITPDRINLCFEIFGQ